MLRFVSLFALVALPATFGEIFGDLRVGDKYVPNAPIQLTCGADTVKAATDKEGSFRITTAGSGKCTFTVTHEGKPVSIPVVVFDKPARYRLVLERGDTAWVLKRV